MIIDPFRTSKGLGDDCQVLTFKKLRNPAIQKPHYKQALTAIESVYGHFGFSSRSLEEKYSGSIFWFSLRRHPSDLSTKVFNRSDISELIAMFKKEAACLPLFLKNISYISFSDQDNVSMPFSVDCDVMEKEEKKLFNSKLIACKGVSPNDNMKVLFRVNVTVKDDKDVQEQCWVVCNYIKGRANLSEELRLLAEDKDLSYSPFVGIAVPIDDDKKSDKRFHGHVFCFLPLPNTDENSTGLPVHVNGFFALGDDRHRVKWPSIDQTERVDNAQKWNRLLCEEVLVEAYADALEYVKSLTINDSLCETNIVYSILPSQANIRTNWDVMVDPLYKRLKDSDIFYTNNEGGKWIQAKDAIFSTLQWQKDDIELGTIQQAEQCIFDLLLKYERNIVRLPSHVAEKFPDVPRITPQYLRNVIRENDHYCKLSGQQKLLLLQFILADRQYDELHDLQLLPLEDDTFGSFDTGKSAYLCSANEMKMFPGTEEKFIKLDIPPRIGDHLNEIKQSGLFNLRALNKEDIPNLLSDTLAANGTYGTDGYFRSTTCHITMKWLDLVWNYIGREYEEKESLERLCLVPMCEDSRSDQSLNLMPLKGFYLVADFEGITSLDQNLCRALGRLRISVINHIAKGETRTNLMGTYCKYPNLEGVYELLEKLYENCQNNMVSLDEIVVPFNDQSSSEEKDVLLNFLSNDCHQPSSGADCVLKKLDIFPETTNTDTVAEHTSIAKNGTIACENNIQVRYPLSLLHLDSKQKALATRLGATEISETKLIENILQSMTEASAVYDSTSIEKFMMYVLRYCTKMSSSDDLNFIIYLGSRIKFIELSSSANTLELAPIRGFFDHTNQILQSLFHFDQSKFLAEKYHKEELEPTLRKFGLKSDNDVKEDDLFGIVKLLDRECQEVNRTDAREIRRCSLQLMEILNKMIGASDIDLANLDGYRWVTFIEKKPVHYPGVLPWYGDHFESLLCTPYDASSSKYATLSASVRCIVETSNHPHLAAKYGWDNPPGFDVCFHQLETVRSVFCISHKAKLNGITKDIYQYMFDNINTLVDKNLKSKAIVCIGDEFHRPTDVFISFPSDENIPLEPYMYKLPDEFLEFSKLFISLGSTEKHSIYSLNTILAKIKEDTETSTNSRVRRIAVNILKMIAALRDNNDNVDEVLVPVQSHDGYLDLRHVKDCTYSDSGSSWLQDDEGDDDVRYVHSDVGAELAESLGVPSFTQRFLSDGGTDEITAYGQSEPLTTSLKRLLENYRDGLAVFKELIQNADDAGAQQIHFLYDERQNKDAKTGLIDANMAKCQGPAFWVYNNAQFTDSDFENIVKLGGETKRAMKAKIGKFGLGFSAVYNLTDVPSFVSGNSLVIFDPHTSHLGKAIKNKNNPGLRLTFRAKSSGMLKRMRNQFLPYNNMFGCDLSGGTMPPYFDGTLFRLPLRTMEQAVNSEIKNKPYSKDDMVELLHLLKDCAGDLLTFTQNLKEIQLFHLPEDSMDTSNDRKLIFRTAKSVLATDPMFNDTSSVMTQAVNACTIKEPFKCTQLISVNMSTYKNELLSVKEDRSSSSHWLVSWASGTTLPVLEKAKQLENSGALNLGSVAVSLKFTDLKKLIPVPFPLEENLLGFNAKSRFFCFLPLPVECKTPIHINGCFSVSSDRKGLMKSTSDEKGETEREVWNRLLLSDAVCKANLALLKSLENFKVSLHPVYSSLWPITDDPSDEASCLSDAFCKAVVNEDHKVFYSPEGRRVSFRESIFLDNTLRHDVIVGEFAFQTFENLFEGEHVPMDMQQSLYLRFCTAGCKEQLLQQTMSIETFYRDIVFPKIRQIDEKKRDALVMHILGTNDNSLQNLLKSNPCIPAMPDGRLKQPRDLVRPRSFISKLFFDEDGRFPMDTNQPFSTEKNLDTLVRLGMMERTLPGELVLERAHSISSLLEYERAIKRCRRLLTYLCREEDQCRQIIGDLSGIPFIPSLQKPNDWPLTWFSNEDGHFSPPNQLFFPEHMDRIACSKLIVHVDKLKGVSDVQQTLELLGVGHEEVQKDVEAQLYAIGHVGELSSEKQKSRLFEICISVYGYLDKSPESLPKSFEDLPIILISDRLVPPTRATTERFLRIDCAPEIYQVLSADIMKYKTFLKQVGVCEKLYKESVILALERVKEDDESVEQENIKLIVNLLELLTDVCRRRNSTLDPEEISCLYVPDDTCVLRKVEEVCEDDGYPLKRQEYMYFVNAKVSKEIIKLLNIKSKRVKHLNKIKGSMPFGQKEELVTRLRGILEDYPRDETILYELLQNADDAGAKEIMFVKDMRQHEMKKGIFSESWSDIQGPALCVFNDSCFSDEDLKGICKLGQGSKSQDPTKTGQFGIGFNAVYHLTDAPSFITRGPSTPNEGTFCAFDPHCAFCPAADDLNPGLQLPDLTELEKIYPGVYGCYLQKEIPRTQGTWFRFPLRNAKMAEISQVCNKEMNSLEGLLLRFQYNMKKCLLFLRSVRQISLCEIDQQGKISVCHQVTSNLEINHTNDLNRFCNECDKLTKNVFANPKSLQEVPKQTVGYSMTIQEDSNPPEYWIIAQTFGFDSDTEVPDDIKEAFECGDIALTPKGAVALPCSPESLDSGYDSFATQHVIPDNANTSLPSYSDYVPEMSPSSPTEKYSRRASKEKGQMFCFLPLPLQNGLPVHLNGHFALQRTRGAMWENKTTKGCWNSLLFETTIANSYVLAIEYMRDTFFGDIGGHIPDTEHVKSALTTYHDAFPQYHEGKTDLIKSMISSFFSNLYEKEFTVFPVLQTITESLLWVGLQQSDHAFPAFFDDLTDQLKAVVQPIYFGLQIEQKEENERKKQEQAEYDARQISNTLKNIGMKILESPLWIYESMHDAFQNQGMLRINGTGRKKEFNKDTHLLTPSDILRFLKPQDGIAPDSCLLNDLDCKITDTPMKSIENTLCLLRYCLQDKPALSRYMEELPLLITNDDKLRRFSSRTPVFISKFCGLLPASSEKFLHRKMVELMQQTASSRCLLQFDLESFARMLPSSVDIATLSKDEPILWDHGMLSVEWMKEFWKYLDTLKPKNIDVLSGWCLIPGERQLTTQHTDILVPCHKSFVLMDINSFEGHLRSVLAALQIPSPHSGYFSKTMRTVVASMHHPMRIIQSLYYHKDNVRGLNTADCNPVLKYLSDNVRRLNSPMRGQLKQLCLFTTVDGDTVELNRKVYIVENADIPTDGLDDFSNTCEVTLLRHNFYASELMSYLGFDRTLSVTDLYVDLILRRFSDLGREHHLLHLHYIRRHLLAPGNLTLQRALQTSAFIFHEGEYKKADCFYSPHVTFLKKLCDQSLLPPEPFGTDEWNSFMEYAGMKTVVTRDIYCKFARQIEQKGDMTEKTKEQSKEMVTYLFDQLSDDRGLLGEIKNIKFVDPCRVKKVFSQIYPQFGCDQLIPFCGSVPSRFAPVVWTNQLILPEYLPADNKIHESLGIQSSPPLQDVVSHTHNVCNSLNKRLREQKTKKKPGHDSLSESNITVLMEQIYTYLQRVLTDTSENKKMLSETPLVHMKDMGIFVKADQVSITFCGKKQIPPYLVEIPLYYGRYKELFLAAGATETVTLGQYSDILYRIQSEVKSSVLGPKQIKDVLAALTGLIILIEESSESGDTTRTSIEESMDMVETLFLPTSTKTLAKSNEMVFVDNKILKKRVIRGKGHQLVFMHSLKDCHKNENLILKLPDRLRPRGLTSVIQKRLISRSNNKEDEKVDSLRKFIGSSRFLNALKKIGDFEDFESYRELLLNLSFVSLSEVRTILSVDGRLITGTEDIEDCLYSEDDRKFYLAASSDPIRLWLKKIGKELFGTLSRFFGKRISSEKIRELVDYMDDPTGFKQYCEEFLDEEENEEDDSLSYHPGQLVPIGLHALLEQGSAILEVGDIVAYEIFDSEIDGDDKDTSNDAEYIFVKIVEKLPLVAGRDPLFEEYRVNTGADNEKVVLGIRLYKVIYPDSSTTTELVIHQFGHDRATPHDKSKVFDEILATLSYAWKQGEGDRKRVVKRLLLLWHPDKNRSRGDEYEKFCKEVTQFIFDIIRRLENGEMFELQEPGGNNRRRRWDRDYDNWHYGGNCSQVWYSFKDRMSSRHSKYQSNCMHFFEQRQRGRYIYIPDPQPAEARRWFRQASMDFQSGASSLESNNTAEGAAKKEENYNWICFKFHQACEKACKAYMYSIDAKRVTKTHYLPNILPYQDISGIDDVLRQIEKLVGSYSRMRYPDVRDIPNVPGTLYTKDQTDKLMELTEKVMEMIHNLL